MNQGVIEIVENILLVIAMPKLNNQDKRNAVHKWHKKVGDYINKGDLLVEIENNKNTIDLECYYNGILIYQGCTTGEEINVNSTLAIIRKMEK